MAKTDKEKADGQNETPAELQIPAAAQKPADAPEAAPKKGEPADPVKSGTKPEKTEEPLLSLDELAAEFRVASWQQAALCRMQGWEPGKRVTRKAYESAINALGQRRQGGGRR